MSQKTICFSTADQPLKAATYIVAVYSERQEKYASKFRGDILETSQR
jgi:hypothetical protein